MQDQWFESSRWDLFLKFLYSKLCTQPEQWSSQCLDVCIPTLQPRSSSHWPVSSWHQNQFLWCYHISEQTSKQMSATSGCWISKLIQCSSYCDAGEWKIEVIRIWGAPLLLLQVTLIHSIEEHPVKSVEQFCLCWSKIVDGFFSANKIQIQKLSQMLNRCSFVFECKQNKF